MKNRWINLRGSMTSLMLAAMMLASAPVTAQLLDAPKGANKTTATQLQAVDGLSLRGTGGLLMKLHPSARIRWSTGAKASRKLLQPGMNVQLEMFDPLAPVPVISAVTIIVE